MKEKNELFSLLFYIIKRLLMLIPLLLIVTAVVFIMLSFAPGDPAVLMSPPEASLERIEQLRIELGIDKPLHIQYWEFLKNLIMNGNLGKSYKTRRPVVDEIARALPVTFSLAFAAITISSIIAVLLGVLSAVKQYSLIDNITKTVLLAAVSMPVFWLGLMLIVVFSVYLGILPSSGWGGGWKYVVLPGITLATLPLAQISRLTRSSMLEILRQNFITACRAKGLPEKIIIFRHVLRNCSISIITIIGVRLGTMLTGSVLTEAVFAIPGLGNLTVTSVYSRDYAMVRGCILVIAAIFAIMNLIVDIAYIYLDPRIKYWRT